MNTELRQDPVSGQWTIFSAARDHRPRDIEAVTQKVGSGLHPCPFCEGSEDQTGGALLAIGDSLADDPNGPGWRVRVVPNKYPALNQTAEEKPWAATTICSPGVGLHEVVIESPHHATCANELTPENMLGILHACFQRLLFHARHPAWKYATLFKNQGAAAGASLEHCHSQILVTPFIPPQIQTEWDRSLQFYQSQKECLFCHLAKRERQTGTRVITQTSQFIAFNPFASRFAWETWILPRRHVSCFENISSAELMELSSLFLKILATLEQTVPGAAYNFVLHNSPFHCGPTAHWHWHWEVMPRTTWLGGFELGTGCYINSIRPETAAAQLRQVGSFSS